MPVVAACLVAAGGLACAEPVPPPPPVPRNAVLIVVDTLRADHLGASGYARETSPSIDRLAAGGMRFSHAYATAPWTKPSVASMFTGLYPIRHGVRTLTLSLSGEVPLLAEILSESGFATAGVISHLMIRGEDGFSRGFDRYDETEARGHWHVSTPGVTARAIAELERLASGERPFFLFVHYFDPHYNYRNHAEVDFAAARAGRLDGRQDIDALRRLAADLEPGELAYIGDLYDEEIRFTDSGIGALLDRIETLGLADATVVVFTADHGEEFLERGRIGHSRSLYDELVRVPLVVRAPGLPSGVVEDTVSLVAIAPTILELLGLDPIEHGIESRSLVPLIRTTDRSPPRPIFTEVDFQPIFEDAGGAFKKAVVSERYKLIRDDRSGEIDLYDLDVDPGEERDISKERPRIVRYLLRDLNDHLNHAKAHHNVAHRIVVTPEYVEKLKSLGYVDEDPSLD